MGPNETESKAGNGTKKAGVRAVSRPGDESQRELLTRAEAIAASLRGADVEVDVTTADGREHLGRRLENVTIDPRRDLISGFDPHIGAVRSFRLSRVTRMAAAGGGPA
jgi:hypothetical protein